MSSLKIYSRSEIDLLYSTRNAEKKWGDCIQTVNVKEQWESELNKSNAEFVLLGIAEDIGIRANYGKAGAANTFHESLKSILSIQNNQFQNAERVFLLGQIDFEVEMLESQNADINLLRNMCEKVDDAVSSIIEICVKSGKKLIIIGGGHNNSYPIIKGVSKALDQQISCLNIDAHSDYRIVEGRHSGNGFRYAKEQGYLKYYSIFGLHENYNSEAIIKELENNTDIQFTLFEDIEVRKRIDAETALNSLIHRLIPETCGLELDLDSVQNIPSSAMSPSGWNANQIRSFVHQSATLLNTKYVHIAEGSVNTGIDNTTVTKLIAYIVSDYIKAH